MTEKQYNVGYFDEPVDVDDYVECNGEYLSSSEAVDRLNELSEENEQLKSKLSIFYNVANCGNCNYHNYDWFDDYDEFEICEKGNDMKYHICKDWEELE